MCLATHEMSLERKVFPVCFVFCVDAPVRDAPDEGMDLEQKFL